MNWQVSVSWQVRKSALEWSVSCSYALSDVRGVGTVTVGITCGRAETFDLRRVVALAVNQELQNSESRNSPEATTRP